MISILPKGLDKLLWERLSKMGKSQKVTDLIILSKYRLHQMMKWSLKCLYNRYLLEWSENNFNFILGHQRCWSDFGFGSSSNHQWAHSSCHRLWSWQKGIHRQSPIYANPWIPVLTSDGMRCSYVKNCA